MADWLVVATIVGPIIGGVVGVVGTLIIERKPRLVTYYGHIASFRITGEQGPSPVNTHAVVIKNSGRSAACNVRLGHNVLPEFRVNPSVGFNVNELPGGGKEIHFETLVPGEEITISYLYFPPLVAGRINTYVKSDEGQARVLNVLLQPQYPLWITILAWILVVLGLITASYWAVMIARFLFTHS